MGKEEVKEAKVVNIDDIIANLHPEQIKKKARDPVRNAHSSYKITPISSYEDFRKEIIKHYQHIHSETHGGTKISDDEAFGRVQRLLSENENYRGIPAAVKAAYDGRMDEVLKSIAQGAESESASHYQSYEIGKIDPFDRKTHVKIARKLKDLYEPLIKGTETVPEEEIAHNYATLLAQHTGLVSSIGSIYGKTKPPSKKPK